MRVPPSIPLVALCFVLGSDMALTQDKAGDVSLKVVKYDDLKEAVLQQRGKVVLVDLWGEF
jgi:hypothetical protein